MENENVFFLLVPVSFILISLDSMLGVLLGIFIQQLTFAYFSIHFDIYVLKSIDNLRDSSQYQSMIYFINVLFRMAILGLISIIFSFVDIQIMYILFGTTIGYMKYRKIKYKA